MKKLLIADDEEEIVAFLKEFFETRKTYQVFTAQSKNEAIEKVGKEKPDLMLLDLRFQNQTGGYEVLEKSKEISPNTKVIMVSAVEERGAIEKALKLGAVDYIAKPLSLEYLENTVVKILKEASE